MATNEQVLPHLVWLYDAESNFYIHHGLRTKECIYVTKQQTRPAQPRERRGGVLFGGF